MPTTTDYKISSILALGTIPAANDDGRQALTRAIEFWVGNAVQSQWPRAIQSFENASYLVGNPTNRFFYDPYNGFGVGTPSSPVANIVDTPMVSDNRLPRATEAMTGLLTEVEPSPRVAPNSTSPEDEDAAALSEIALGLVYERPLRMPSKLRKACQISAIFEGVIAETEYAESGERVEVPVIGMVKEFDELYQEEIEVPAIVGMEVEARKDISVRMWTPLHITVDPGATTVDDLTWVARTTFEDIDFIKQRFVQNRKRTAKDGFFLTKDDSLAQSGGAHHPLYWYTKLQDLLSSPQQYGCSLAPSLLTANGSLPNQTTFTVIDVRPTDAFPHGRTLVVAGGKLIFAGEARAWHEKYPWRWHPYSFFTWFPIEGKFFGMSMLSELVPLQKRINAIDALVRKNREHMAIGQWWLPKHCRVKQGSISGMTGEQYEYTDIQGLGKPTRVENNPLPQELLQERADCVSAIEYISATGTLDEQIAASAARSGSVLDSLRSDKLRNKGPMIRDYEQFVESISQNILIEMQLNLLAEDEVLTERIRLAARDYSMLSIQTFTGASLRDHHSVSIDIASELRHSPEALEQRALEFLQYKQGNVTPSENAAILAATRLDKFVRNEQDASIQRARRMISRIVGGMMQAFMPMDGIDDPTVMAPEFQNAILSDRFLDYPPPVKAKLLEAFDHFSKAAAARAQAAMMQSMMAAGVQGPNGQTPTPSTEVATAEPTE